MTIPTTSSPQDTSPTPSTPSNTKARRTDFTANIAAMIVLLCWLLMLAWMTAHAQSAGDAQWARLVSLLASVEAVSFAAAGALFGTVIQKQRVLEANERADLAKQEAHDSNHAAIAGKILARTIKSQPLITPQTADGKGAATPPDLVRLAQTLFPDA